MGILKRMYLEEALGEVGPWFDCDWCGDGQHASDEQDLERLKYQDRCDHCEHVFTKDD